MAKQAKTIEREQREAARLEASRQRVNEAFGLTPTPKADTRKTLTNPQRRRMAAGGAALAAGAEHDEPQSMLIDTLANLMHWAELGAAMAMKEWDDPLPVDFDEALRIARNHFEDERDGGDE